MNLIIFFNCFGDEILTQLKASKNFTDKYNVKYIPIYDYLHNDFPKSIKNDLLNCDVIILQYIKNEREYIYHTRICSFLHPNCKIILLPHYVFSGYWIKFQFPENFDESMTNDQLENLLNSIDIDEKIIIDNYTNSLEEFKEIEKNCTIKMYDLMVKYAKEIRLFNSRSYPTSLFFNLVASEILKELNINDNIEHQHTGFAYNVRYPILPCIKKKLDLKFYESETVYSKKNIIKVTYLYLLQKKITDNNNTLFEFNFNLSHKKTNHLYLLSEIIKKKKN